MATARSAAGGGSRSRSRSYRDGPEHWALSVNVSEAFLNRAAAAGVGEGMSVAPLRQQFAIPMLGEVEMTMGMTIVGVEFKMASANDGRLAASIRAAGSLELHSDSPMPPMPGRAIVRGDVLVTPEAELREDGTFYAHLDLPGSTLIGMTFEGFEGAATDSDTAAAMGQMLFATIGGELFGGLALHMGVLGIDLGAEEAAVFGFAGVHPAPAVVRIMDGSMAIGLPAVPGLGGHAAVVPAGDDGIGVGVADGAMAAVAVIAGSMSLGVELPIEVDFRSDGRGVGGMVRNQRIVRSQLLPDLRPGLRYTVSTQMSPDGENVEIGLREAWVELPFVPTALNQLNRVIGGVAGLAPWRFKVPAVHALPAPPGSSEAIGLRITEVRGVDGGVAIRIAGA